MEVTINYNGQAVAVEVTLEVYEFLDRADHKAENLSHEQRRHWDGREFDEYIVATEGVGIYGETPEEYLCRMETLGELMAVLDTCTEAQRRRFLLYALDGLTLAEIGAVCGCSKVSVYESIDAVRKKFLKFLMIFDRHANLKYKYGNRHFWCRGYYVDTVGRNEKTIREYVRNQLQEDIASDQICMKEFTDPFTGEPVTKGK